MKNKIKIFLFVLFVLITYLFFFQRKQMDITPLKQYVDDCIPCKIEIEKQPQNRSPYSKCTDLSIPPENVIKILNKRVIDSEYKRLVILAYLKLYKNQLSLSHQSFEIRESPFILKRFSKSSVFSRALCEVMGRGFIEKKLGPEFISASDVYDYVLKNKIYLKDKDIFLVLNTINEIKKRNEVQISRICNPAALNLSPLSK